MEAGWTHLVPVGVPEDGVAVDLAALELALQHVAVLVEDGPTPVLGSY